MELEKSSKTVDFFLGANSPAGFAGYFNELIHIQNGHRGFVIKGGPGTGKSSLMKKVAQALEGKDECIERIHCSSDPDSLDGVIGKDANASIADGTAPHVIEPDYPGACQTTVNLCEYWDEAALDKNREEIVSLNQKNKALHARCTRYLKAAHALLSDNEAIALECTDFLKIRSFSQKLIHKEIPPRKGSAGKEHKRLLSAVTPQGILLYRDTAAALCDRVYVIKDDFGAVSRGVMANLRDAALAAGYEVYTCYCPLEPLSKVEHLLIPQLSLGFVTANKFIDPKIPAFRTVNFSRFTNVEQLRRKKQRLSFNKKAACELFEEAVRTLKEAKAVHDDLESCYLTAVDFSRVDEKAQEVIAQFIARCGR